MPSDVTLIGDPCPHDVGFSTTQVPLAMSGECQPYLEPRQSVIEPLSRDRDRRYRRRWRFWLGFPCPLVSFIARLACPLAFFVAKGFKFAIRDSRPSILFPVYPITGISEPAKLTLAVGRRPDQFSPVIFHKLPGSGAVNSNSISLKLFQRDHDVIVQFAFDICGHKRVSVVTMAIHIRMSESDRSPPSVIAQNR